VVLPHLKAATKLTGDPLTEAVALQVVDAAGARVCARMGER